MGKRPAHAGRCSTHRLGIAVDQILGITLVQMRQRERRTGTVAQQTFEPRPVGPQDAYRAIHREAAVVRLGAHLGGVIQVDQVAPDEGGEDTGPHSCLHVGERSRVESEGCMKADARCLVRGIVVAGADSKTPSMTQQWKCTCSFRLEPNRLAPSPPRSGR
jgi:hypothetical protein